MKELPLYGKIELALGAAVMAGMCAVFLSHPVLDCSVETARTCPENLVVQTGEKDSPRSLLPGEKIPINTADRFDLSRLPGVGDTEAQAIVNFRDRHGPFKRLEQVRRVKGIDAESWAQIKNYICLYEDTM